MAWPSAFRPTNTPPCFRPPEGGLPSGCPSCNRSFTTHCRIRHDRHPRPYRRPDPTPLRDPCGRGLPGRPGSCPASPDPPQRAEHRAHGRAEAEQLPDQATPGPGMLHVELGQGMGAAARGLPGDDPGTCVGLAGQEILTPNGVADLYLKPQVLPGALANDLPASEAAVLAATQRPIASNALVEKSGTPAWKSSSWAPTRTPDSAGCWLRARARPRAARVTAWR